MSSHDIHRMSEPVGRLPPPTIFINISPKTSQENTNHVSQEGMLAFLAGVVVGVALAFTFKQKEDK